MAENQDGGQNGDRNNGSRRNHAKHNSIIVLNCIIARIFKLYNISLNVSFAFSLNGRSPAVWDFFKSKMAAMG